MTNLGRLVLALLLVGAAFVLDAAGALDSIDRVLTDMRFSLTGRPASHDVVVVEIDSRSLAEVGVWPWPRSVHARLLDRLMALDASDVAFDVDFSTASDPDEDAAFAAALKRAGGFAWLAALEQNASADGTTQVNTPIPALRVSADPVEMNVHLDRQGRIVSFPSQVDAPGGAIPALAEALAGKRAQPDRTIYIDYGIDIGQIDRISAADVLDGTVDAARIAGKQVIVGASAIELRDQFAAPRFGLVPGALAQAAALETVKAHRELTMLGAWPGLVLGAVLAIVAARRRRPWSLSLVGIAATAAIVFTEGAALLLQLLARTLVTTAAIDVAVLLLAGFWLIEELRAEHKRRQAAQRRLAYLASHDAITGALSRQGLIETLGAARNRVSVLLVGIARLDLVRGALGQDIAEQALVRIAQALRQMVTAELAVVERDTFALVWDGPVGGEEIENHCDRIREGLELAIDAGGHAVFIECTFASASTVGIETALRQAELALSDSEHNGSPRRFTPAIEARVIARRRIDSALRRAIDAGGIGVHFQPQVRLSDGRLVGVEALARWEDPELGPVPPGEFIPLAEETGLIVRLGELVLREACRQAALWDWDGTLAVNLSPAQMQLSDVVGMVDAALESSGFPAGRLDLEVTESLLVDTGGQTDSQLRALRTRHIGLAIDDFGTGYSSFSYLAELDCDKIKIDRSFLRGLGTRPASATVIRSIVELAHNLGKTVVAEGVQDQIQLKLLRSLGCDIGQGFLLGRPMPGTQLVELIERLTPERPARAS